MAGMGYLRNIPAARHEGPNTTGHTVSIKVAARFTREFLKERRRTYALLKNVARMD